MLVPLGADGSTAIASRPERLDLLGTVVDTTGLQVDRWNVSAAALDASGAISDPVQVTAVVDRVAPAVHVVAPPLSLPWPFAATLHGTTDAGASVSLSGALPVVAGSDGSFELPAQLAPWPQTLEVSAVDPAGNTTVGEVSVMGGADLQGLPWPAIGAVAVLIGALLSSMRGVRRQRPVAGTAATAGTVVAARSGHVSDLDAEHGAVIEELSSGRIRPGD